jgi:hypothetical protein
MSSRKFGICTGRKLTRSRASITTRLGLTSELSPGCVRIALSGCSAFVMMVQTTDFSNLGHLPMSHSRRRYWSDWFG